MSRTGFCIRFISAVSLALLCVCLVRCIVVPVRTPTKSRGISDEIGKKLDLEFIKLGTTTREEIDQKLGWINVGLKDDRIFLGRWADSSWGVAWAIGSYTGAAAGWNRKWTIHNLVLYLDEKGIVQQKLLIPDEEIISTLSELILRDPGRSLNLSAPIQLPVEYGRSSKHIAGTLLLGKDDFMFLGDRKTSILAYDFKTSPQNISHLRVRKRVASNSEDPHDVGVMIYFKQGISVGNKITVQMNLPDTVTLLIYTLQTQPNSCSK